MTNKLHAGSATTGEILKSKDFENSPINTTKMYFLNIGIRKIISPMHWGQSFNERNGVLMKYLSTLIVGALVHLVFPPSCLAQVLANPTPTTLSWTSQSETLSVAESIEKLAAYAVWSGVGLIKAKDRTDGLRPEASTAFVGVEQLRTAEKGSSRVISGIVWLDLAYTGDPAGVNLAVFGSENVRIVALDADGNEVAETRSGYEGRFTLPSLPPGSYIVSLDETTLQTNAEFLQDQTVVLTDQDTTVYLGLIVTPSGSAFSISGEVWDDFNEDGIFNDDALTTGRNIISISVFRPDGTPLRSATTENSGFSDSDYFIDMSSFGSGTYLVRINVADLPTRSIMTTDFERTVTLESFGEGNATVYFGYHQLPSGAAYDQARGINPAEKFRWYGEPGKRYRVEMAPDLDSPFTVIASGLTLGEFEVPTATPLGFFRVVRDEE